MITVRSPDTISSSCFTLYVPSDPVPCTPGHAVFRILMNARVVCAPLDWISVKSCLCLLRLDRSVHVSSSRLNRRCMHPQIAALLVLSRLIPSTAKCAFEGRCGCC